MKKVKSMTQKTNIKKRVNKGKSWLSENLKNRYTSQ